MKIDLWAKSKGVLKNIHIIAVLYRSFKGYQGKIILLVLMGLVSGILEGIGVNALIPLFSFATKQAGGYPDSISQMMEKAFAILHIDFSITTLLVFILLLFFVRTLVLLLFYYVKIQISATYEEETRKTLLKGTLGASWSYLLKQKFGTLETLIITHVQYGANALLSLSTTLMAGVVLVVYVAIAFNISFVITASALVLGVFSLLILQPIFSKTKQVGGETARALEDVAHFVNQNIVGMKTLKYMGVLRPLLQQGDVYFTLLRTLKVRVYLYKNFAPQLLQLIGIIFICIFFGVSYSRGYLNFGALVAVIYLVQRMFVYIQQLQNNIHSMSEALPYLEGVMEYQKKVEAHTEYAKGDEALRQIDGDIIFKNVSFSYTDEATVLEGISFTAKKGEHTAIIGPSGAGKTTIVDLLLRLFTPQKGTIFIAGTDIQRIPLEVWRNAIGYVSQDIFLIHGTISENILFYDDTLTERDAIEAAKKAHAYEFIQKLEHGMDTVVGDRGVMLSVGQRQRIIIARMLVRNPKIVILDEATSALDTESEEHIQKVIEELRNHTTVILIAHRLSTVKNADTLIVVKDGCIVEKGSPKELLATSDSYFYTMYHGKELL